MYDQFSFNASLVISMVVWYNGIYFLPVLEINSYESKIGAETLFGVHQFWCMQNGTQYLSYWLDIIEHLIEWVWYFLGHRSLKSVQSFNSNWRFEIGKITFKDSVILFIHKYIPSKYKGCKMKKYIKYPQAYIAERGT